MNIQSEKLELFRLILHTDNPGILSSVKRIFSRSKQVDFWDSLLHQHKDDILEGIEDVKMEKTVDFDEFIKKHQ